MNKYQLDKMQNSILKENLKYNSSLLNHLINAKGYLWMGIVLILLSANLFAQDDCFPKKPNSWVVDEVGVFSQQEKRQLEQALESFTQNTSNQIVILVLDDLCGHDPAMFATEIGHKWGVGQADLDNGVVILVKPTGGQGQRKISIVPGYGLEGRIPDAIAKRIIENEMIPRFKNGDIKGGIFAGTQVVMDLAKQEYSSTEYAQKVGKRSDSGGSPLAALPILFFIIIFLLARVSGARSYAKRNNTNFLLALLFMSSMSSHRGSYGNFRSGGGSFGGGGFSGFGGGGFGGGGASGSW